MLNLINPSNKIQCDDCKRDITRNVKILADQNDICVSCFACYEEIPQQYHVINKLDFPLFDQEWTAEQELLLLEGIQKHGFCNWGQISQLLCTSKTKEQIQDHYFSLYLQDPSSLENTPILAKRDSFGKIIKINSQMYPRKISRQHSKNYSNYNVYSYQRGALTVNYAGITGSSPAQIVGYMPKRGDFQVQYDNDAQLLLAQLQFNDDDSPQQTQMKFSLLEIYNQKLNERVLRKDFVISRKLLDLKQQQKLEKTRTKQQKQIYNMMKVFARFSTAQDHQALVQGIIKQKQIRAKLIKGFKSFAELQQEIVKKIDMRTKRKDEFFKSKKQKRQSVQKVEIKDDIATRQQEQLCKRFNISCRQYLIIKQAIIRQSIKQGYLQKDNTLKYFKLQKPVVSGIFDFLVKKRQIIANYNDYCSS